MLIGGAIGALVRGHCADRYGRRAVMVWAMVPLVALLALIPIVGLAGFIVVIAAVGFALDGPFPTTVVLGQEYLPDRVGLAAGVT
jgi:FSR family fosmidomycin resistance protein-like MFS transporter